MIVSKAVSKQANTIPFTYAQRSFRFRMTEKYFVLQMQYGSKYRDVSDKLSYTRHMFYSLLAVPHMPIKYSEAIKFVILPPSIWKYFKTYLQQHMTPAEIKNIFRHYTGK